MATFDELEEKYSGYREAREISNTYKEIKEIFKKGKQNFDPNDIEQLIQERPKRPHFPFLILGAAMFKDILDIPEVLAEATLIVIVLTTIISFFFSVILFVWCLGKLSGGWWKKAMIGWLWRLFVLDIIIEFIPFLKIVPANTIFILMAYYKELKIVKLFDLALKKLHDSGVMKLLE